MTRRSALCVIALWILLAGCDRNSHWPSRPITLICPWSAGGGTDRVARQLAVQLEDELDVPVNVVNATGGGGVTGHTRGATANADGYTITLATVELNMLHWQGHCPITPESFQPLAMLNRDNAAIFVLKDSPWSTIHDLESTLRETEHPLRASGTASGGIWHLALVGWLAESKIPTESMTWISINGSAPSLQELMAGGVEVVCCSIPEARALLDAGEIRCLGVMSDERSPALPDAPTMIEQNIDWSIGGWRGLMYPLGVPDERVATMQQAVLNVARSDEFRAFMDSAGFQIRVADADQFKSFLAASDASFGAILQSPTMIDSGKRSLSPYFLPALLMALLVVIAGVGFVSSRTSAVETDVKTAGAERWRMIAFVAAVVLFVAICETVGFVISAALMLSIMLLTTRVRLPVAAAIVLVGVPGLYQLFAGALGVPLPWGWLGW